MIIGTGENSYHDVLLNYWIGPRLPQLFDIGIHQDTALRSKVPIAPNISSEHLFDKLTEQGLDRASKSRKTMVMGNSRCISHCCQLVTIGVEPFLF